MLIYVPLFKYYIAPTLISIQQHCVSCVQTHSKCSEMIRLRDEAETFTIALILRRARLVDRCWQSLSCYDHWFQTSSIKKRAIMEALAGFIEMVRFVN